MKATWFISHMSIALLFTASSAFSNAQSGDLHRMKLAPGFRAPPIFSTVDVEEVLKSNEAAADLTIKELKLVAQRQHNQRSLVNQLLLYGQQNFQQLEHSNVHEPSQPFQPEKPRSILNEEPFDWSP